MSKYEIVTVPEDASLIIEYVGSKEKFWYMREDGERWLFKAARNNTGEDWAEKVAAELCTLLKLPHASYELAEWAGKKGVVSKQMQKKSDPLILGNVLLARRNIDYPRFNSNQFLKQEQYTPDLVFDTLEDEELNIQPPRGWQPIQEVTSASEMFVGYLLLDAWIGNTDRHDQNWGVIEYIDSHYYLAPTFDHASSLGRELRDTARKERLETSDKNYQVEAYLKNKKGRSPFYANNEQLFNIEVFRRAASRYPEAGAYWIEQLAEVSHKQIEYIFKKLPERRISPTGIEFAIKVLHLNRAVLLT